MKDCIIMYTLPIGSHPYEIQSGDSLWMISQRHHTTIQAITAVNPGLDMSNIYIGDIILVPQSCDIYRMPAQEFSDGDITEEALSNHLRMLWEQHVYWTRLVILSMVFSLPETELATERLLRNPKDFETALIPFYGEDIAGEFEELFTTHLTIAADLIKAAIENNSTAVSDTEKLWYENADQIAAFLGSINPFWSAQEWQRMLYDHLAMTKDEAVDIISNNFSESITEFDEIEKQALDMADMMIEGIVNQFPENF